MKTVINNNERIFLISKKGFFTEHYFCNIGDIPKIIAKVFLTGDTYTIFEYWNHKFRRCSKSNLNEMFENNNIDFKL